MAIQIPDTNVSSLPATGGSARNPTSYSGDIAALRSRLPELERTKQQLAQEMQKAGGSPAPELARNYKKVCRAIDAIRRNIEALEKADQDAQKNAGEAKRKIEQAQRTGNRKAAKRMEQAMIAAQPEQSAVIPAKEVDEPKPGRRFDRYDSNPAASTQTGRYQAQAERGGWRVDFKGKTLYTARRDREHAPAEEDKETGSPVYE